MEISKITAYKLTLTQSMKNIKELIGQTVNVKACKLNAYTRDGEVHNVLAILLDNGEMYRTEGLAFIDRFNDYWGVFGDDEDRPAITIKGITGKRGNPYVSFDVVG